MEFVFLKKQMSFLKNGQLHRCVLTWNESVDSLTTEQFCTASGFPAAMMWKTQGSLCWPTALELQHMRVPYSRVRVGVNVSTERDPLVRMNRDSTCLASAELLNVHLIEGGGIRESVN